MHGKREEGGRERQHLHALSPPPSTDAEEERLRHRKGEREREIHFSSFLDAFKRLGGGWQRLHPPPPPPPPPLLFILCGAPSLPRSPQSSVLPPSLGRRPNERPRRRLRREEALLAHRRRRRSLASDQWSFGGKKDRIQQKEGEKPFPAPPLLQERSRVLSSLSRPFWMERGPIPRRRR